MSDIVFSFFVIHNRGARMGIELLFLLIFGLIAGVVAGFFGIGGGILFTPLLFTLFGQQGVENPVAWAIGSSLFCTFAASLSSSVQQFRGGNLYLKEGAQVGFFGTLGVWFGKQVTLSPFYTEGVFVSFFGLLLAVVAIFFYLKPTEENELSVENGVANYQPKKSNQETFLSLPKTFTTGGIGGFLAALAGIGGGVAMVPIMSLIYGLRITKAVSVSSLAIVFISTSGWIQFALDTPVSVAHSDFSLGYVDFAVVLPLAITSWIGGFFGVKFGKLVSDRTAAIGFALLTLIVAVVMVLRIL